MKRRNSGQTVSKKVLQELTGPLLENPTWSNNCSFGQVLLAHECLQEKVVFSWGKSGKFEQHVCLPPLDIWRRATGWKTLEQRVPRKWKISKSRIFVILDNIDEIDITCCRLKQKRAIWVTNQEWCKNFYSLTRECQIIPGIGFEKYGEIPNLPR